MLIISCTTTETAAQSITSPDSSINLQSSEDFTNANIPQAIEESDTVSPSVDDEITEPLVFDLPLYDTDSPESVAEPQVTELDTSDTMLENIQQEDLELPTAPIPDDPQPAPLLTSTTEESPVLPSEEKDDPSQNQTITAQETIAEQTKVISTDNDSIAKELSPKTADTIATETVPVLPVLEDSTESTQEQDSASQIPLPTPSRSISLNKNQYLDIDYIGRGWIYLGELHQETNKEDLMSFYNRDISNNKHTVFTLRAEKTGETLLHFYKNDPVNNEYIDDYLSVSVEEGVSTSTHITAPSYADIVPPRQKASPQTSELAKAATTTEKKAPSPTTSQVKTQQPVEHTTTVPATSEAAQKTTIVKQTPDNEPEGTSSLFIQAQEAYNKKEYQKALNLITTYLDINQEQKDEALFLEAQILEQKSPVRNIKQAIAIYDSIIQQFPSSPYWKKANERSKYLKRFYINIQ
ncbi:MAG: hypothetical protein K6E51_04885 [Treponema sp.]|nr:hypothetical protein [Treponema sp.]